MKKIKQVLLCVTVCASSHAFALDDTLQNREREAMRYENSLDMESLLNGMYSAMASQMPKNSPLNGVMIQFVREEIMSDTDLRRIVHQMNVKHFTANELDALANFYGSPEGVSITQKTPHIMNAVMQEVQPLMQQRMHDKMPVLQQRIKAYLADHPEAKPNVSK
ncbi:hypothetical protein DTO96_101922 [Ephemeroptericola cinctiostellae]|uniref:DUF2059 domain-containing protein n=1 Tax=Ephemeroptericola cinctiostellae TaxID=2268024 RepID=A0A345DCU3_9BURK|nr:DUF2059 domain-containing protein [Ephemeroptericola cinctiostellae]AXF86181.1 hypothetical protein DTO96_101922 [Ephemeroptericola cinctiostellae]